MSLVCVPFAAGFTTTSEALAMSPVELSEELDISRVEALKMLEELRKTQGSDKGGSVVPETPVKATDLLRQERNRGAIVTFCDELDQLLGHGVPIAKVTEICGAPGIGKTQFGMQLAVNAHIPTEFGGVNGEVVYIDTEGSFVPERVKDMASAMIEHLNAIKTNTKTVAVNIPSVDDILNKIHYFRVHNYIEQVAVVRILHDFLIEHTNVKLIVIDSIAFHFRRDFTDMVLRTRLLGGMSQSLISLAREHQLAVLLTNQMTTKTSTLQSSSQLVPALGESWGHASTIRLILYWEQGTRHALLYKSPSEKEGTTAYQVTVDGIRSTDAESSESMQRKRYHVEPDTVISHKKVAL